MANQSIYKAFERMWLHITQKFATNESVTSLQVLLDEKVPNTRTINGKSLSEDIILSASDIGLDGSIDLSSYATIEYVDNIVGDIETLLSTI